MSEEMHRFALQCFNIAFGRVRSTAEMLELLAPTAVASGSAPAAQPDAPAAVAS